MIFLASVNSRLPACARRREFPSLATSIHSEALATPRGHDPPHASTGLLTRCPSPTPFGLGLGPTNPTRTDLPSETLDIRCGRFTLPFRYSYQHSHFQPLQRPSQVRLHRCWNAPLPLSQVSGFGGMLSPVQLSAHMRLTSELLRTL